MTETAESALRHSQQTTPRHCQLFYVFRIHIEIESGVPISFGAADGIVPGWMESWRMERGGRWTESFYCFMSWLEQKQKKNMGDHGWETESKLKKTTKGGTVRGRSQKSERVKQGKRGTQTMTVVVYALQPSIK